MNKEENKEKITKKLKAIIAKSLNVPEEEVTPDSTLLSLGADSLDNAQAIMDIEKGFDMAIPDTDMEKFDTVQTIVDYIEKHTPVPAPSAE